MLFKEKIENWEDWSRVFQSIDAFEGIIREIYMREGLSGEGIISNVTPGTNAVFKSDDYILKIFVPKESGYDSHDDFFQESEAMIRAGKNGVRIPTVICTGEIEDKYLFRYIVMEYIEGVEGGGYIENCSNQEKSKIMMSLRDSLRGINIKPLENVVIDYVEEFKKNQRWDILKSSVRTEIIEEIKNMEHEEMVYVHGDITGENVLVSKDSELYIIDYADSCIAPKKYEYPPIVLDLLNCNKELIKMFAGDMDYKNLIRKTLEGVLIHQFGAFILKDLFMNHKEIKVGEINSLKEIKDILIEILEEKGDNTI